MATTGEEGKSFGSVSDPLRIFPTKQNTSTFNVNVLISHTFSLGSEEKRLPKAQPSSAEGAPWTDPQYYKLYRQQRVQMFQTSSAGQEGGCIP